jgi:mannose-1-phosphate guanylyltransferase
MNARPKLSSAQGPIESGERDGLLWAVVLAGGQGVRLRPLARLVCGDDRPKQYVPLLGPRTLLGQTLDRVRLVIPTARTAVVTVQGHAAYVAAECSGPRAPHVLVQPDNRGTAAGILFPAHWISWRDPDATVAVFPSDHFVLEETTFMAHVVSVAEWVERHSDQIVLLGAEPSGPEVEYGWIEGGEAVGHAEGGAIYQILRFWEKPSSEGARACLAAGCRWNTFVVVAKARALLRAGQEQLPEICERLALIRPFVGTEDERWAIAQAYALMPAANFSRAILEPCTARLAVSPLPPLTWCDLGTPRRVFELLDRVHINPAWLAASARPA